MEFVMAKVRKPSKSSNGVEKSGRLEAGRSSHAPPDAKKAIHIPPKACKDTFGLVEPQINAEGVHLWPFDVSCPIDVLFMTVNDREKVRINRHGYFEVLFLFSGSGVCHIQDRLLPFNEGDLAVIGNTLYHRIECAPSSSLTIAALFFEPEIICCNGATDNAEYLTPFLFQDTTFPHIISARTGIPRQVLEMMLRIQSELPASTPAARLALRTYLKMLLVFLVNHYAQHTGKVETFQRQ
jgi:mannose-6-phosphate isomerase-like protein (cupin superfamily)